MRTKTKTKTIDDYLATLSSGNRAALEKLRKVVLAAAPRAEECISYQLPAFRLDGKVLVLFGATASHCAFYPGSGTAVEAFKDELRGYNTSKSTIRFQAGKPLGRRPGAQAGEVSSRRKRRPTTACGGPRCAPPLNRGCLAAWCATTAGRRRASKGGFPDEREAEQHEG